MSKFLVDSQTDQLEGSEDIFGDITDTDSAIKFQTNLNTTHNFTFAKDYYPAGDGLFIKVWVRGYSMGSTMKDFSGEGLYAYQIGEPLLIDGAPFDYYIYDGSTLRSRALRFNRPTSSMENTEHIGIQDGGLDGVNLAISDPKKTLGISWFFRVRPLATNLQNGHRRTLYCKIDDTTPDNAFRLSIDHINKRLVIQVKQNSNYYSKETGVNTFVEGNVYDIFVTLDDSNNIHCWMGKVDADGNEDASMTDMTLQSSYPEEWGPDMSNLEARLFKRGPIAEDGHFYGDFYDFKIYSLPLVNTDIQNHWENKLTWSNIDRGHVMVTNHWGTKHVLGAGYTTTGYTTAGYTT